MAWQSIREDVESLGLDQFQTRWAVTKADDADKTVDSRVPETYVWILNPVLPADDPTDETRWETTCVKIGDNSHFI